MLLGIVSLLLFRIGLFTIGLILAVFLGVSILLLGILSLFLVGLLVFVFFLFLILSGLLIVILLLLLSGLFVVLLLLFLVIFFLLFVGRGIGCILGSTSSSAASTRCLLGLGLVCGNLLGILCSSFGSGSLLLGSSFCGMLLFIGLLLLLFSDLLLLLVLTLLLISVLLSGFLLLLDIFLGSLLLSFDSSLSIFLSLVTSFRLLAALFIKSILNCCCFSSSASCGGTCSRRAWNGRVTAASWAEILLHLSHELLDSCGVTSREFKVGESTVGREINGSIFISSGRGLVNSIE